LLRRGDGIHGVRLSSGGGPSRWGTQLVNAIIRPPRAEYEIEQLGPSSFVFCKKRFQRHDLVLVNQRGLAMQCSHWEPVERPAEALPCVVFVHGNSSARLEGINQLSLCIAFGATLFAFDCAGSGKARGCVLLSSRAARVRRRLAARLYRRRRAARAFAAVATSSSRPCASGVAARPASKTSI